MELEFLYSFSAVSILSIVLLYITGYVLKMPTAIGFLIAGLLSSKSILGISSVIKKGDILGHFGMLFLMFYIGMKFSYSRLSKLKKYVKSSIVIYIVSTIAVILVFIAFSFTPYFPHIGNIYTKILLALCFSMSSTAVTMQIIEQSQVKNEAISHLVITSLIIQDVVAVLLMLFAINNVFVGSISKNIFHQIFIPLLITSSYIVCAGNFLFKPLFRFLCGKDAQNLLPILSICLIVFSGYLSAVNGISQEFGVFISGMLLGDTEYKYSIISDIKPFQDLFLGLFFLSIGASLNLYFLKENFLKLTLFFLGIFVIKFISLLLSAYSFNKKIQKSIFISLKLCNFSEIAFVILLNLYKSNSVSLYEYEFFKTITLFSFIISPIANQIVTFLINKKIIVSESKEGISQNDNYDVIIVGYNENIESICHMLEERDITYIILEKNLTKVQSGRKKKLHVLYGDGFNHKILYGINLKKANTIFFNFHLMNNHIKSIRVLKGLFPHINLVVLTAMENNNADDLGIQVALNSSIEQSINVARVIFKSVDKDLKEIDLENYIDTVRNRFYQNTQL